MYLESLELIESDDGPKITWALIKSIGLMQKMMDSESI